MKRALIFLLALLVTPALPGVSGAHVEVTPPTAPAGKAVKLALSVGHGCDGAATTGLDVLMPPQAAYYAPGKVEGWKASSPPDRLSWKGGPLPDDEVKEFPFNATFYGKKNSELTFKIIQRCEGGAQTAWIQTAGEGGAAPENPASVLTLTSSAVEPAPATSPEPTATAESSPDKGDEGDVLPKASENTSDDNDGGGGIILPIIGVVLIAASLTAFMVIQRGKKRD